MKVLVIGSSGFIGQALVSRLLAEGHEVEAWDRRPGAPLPGQTLRTVDLLGTASLPMPEGRPWEAAFHLAAHAVPGITWTRERVLQNLTMTARVFDHLAEHAPGCRAIFASSAFVYAPTREPLREDAPPRVDPSLRSFQAAGRNLGPQPSERAPGLHRPAL